MRKIIFHSLIAFIVVISTGCPKPCIEAIYSFAIQSQIVPDKDSVKVGDTIYLISTTPTKMRDLSSRIEVDYNGATIASTLSIGELISGNTFPRDAVFDFDYASLKGRIYNDRSIPSPDGIQQLSYQEMSGNYELKIAIIPKKKGTYAFGISNGISTGRNKKNICEKANFNNSLTNTNQHLYLYQQSRPGYTSSEYERTHMYCFKVY